MAVSLANFDRMRKTGLGRQTAKWKRQRHTRRALRYTVCNIVMCLYGRVYFNIVHEHVRKYELCKAIQERVLESNANFRFQKYFSYKFHVCKN